MMDDLVKRLREPCKAEHTYDPDKDEAAARIEALEAEVARYREALEPFSEMADCYDPVEDDDHLHCWVSEFTPTLGQLRIARAALSTAPVGEA